MSPADRKPLGATLRSARARAELTQSEVARRVGLTVELYSRLERGALDPSALLLRRLCQVLTLHSDELLGLASPASSPMLRLLDAARGLTASQLRMLQLLARTLREPSEE